MYQATSWSLESCGEGVFGVIRIMPNELLARKGQDASSYYSLALRHPVGAGALVGIAFDADRACRVRPGTGGAVGVPDRSGMELRDRLS